MIGCCAQKGTKEMNFLSSVKSKILYPMCTYAVFICLFLYIITIPAGITSAIVSTVFYLILIYSLGIALTNFVMRCKKLNLVLRYLIHFALNLGLFIAFFKTAFYIYENNLLQPLNQEGRMLLIAMIVFIVLYAVIALFTGLLNHLKNKRTDDHDAYESIFK